MPNADLMALYAAQRDAEQWTEACETLWRLAQSAETSAERAQIWRQRAAIQDEKLMDLREAIASLRRAIEAAPDDRASLAAYGDLCRRTESWTDLTLALQALVDAALATTPPDRAEATRRLTELGWVYRTQLGDLELADAAFARATALQSEDG